jgi:hypothetical protein
LLWDWEKDSDNKLIKDDLNQYQFFVFQ